MKALITPPKFFDLERIIHSLKTALACLIGYGLTRLIQFQADQWIIITILVVMCAQINVGSVIQKSYMRFLGTVAGSLVAGLTLAFFGHNPTVVAIVITLVALFFSYIATGKSSYSDAGTLGAVTVAIILISQQSTILIAIHRFVEISMGLLIASLVSQFILPIHASSHIRRTQANTLKQLRDYYTATLIATQDTETIAAYQDLDEDIVKSLSTQRSLAKESKRELFGLSFDAAYFEKVLRCEKEIFRSMVCMRYACDMLPSGRLTLTDLPTIKTFHLAICDTLEKIASGLEKKSFNDIIVNPPSLDEVRDATAIMARTNNNDQVYTQGFLFCAELLIIQLRNLIALLRKSEPI